MTDITPFSIDIDPAAIEDLRSRLARTRWPEAETPDEVPGSLPGRLDPKLAGSDLLHDCPTERRAAQDLGVMGDAVGGQRHAVGEGASGVDRDAPGRRSRGCGVFRWALVVSHGAVASSGAAL